MTCWPAVLGRFAPENDQRLAGFNAGTKPITPPTRNLKKKAR